ncbi:signal peptidase II [Desulfohalobium retbaense]|uniref:Lipoprotein signal peptidase n=1 Tax=Desulfohalobium retbaense (strain ATCC 49708 / DSM 5692 / JCM 16813 / HR100) TaxID=485915 RepID=C8X282_DESRD|nr:signal peptidase II [Desulfohalobium retbaense]ACV68405.1 lipoprotein signal peptidase [Desulfohalobium retbaense DSM 5692]
MRTRYALTGGLGAAILALDQLTKLLIQSSIPLYESRTVIPGFFDLVHIHNRGAAFGFLNRADIEWQTYFFIAVSALAVVLIFQLLRTVDRRDMVLFTGLGCILGGALGNLVDRIRVGHVIDFLDIYIGSAHWPAFNIADIGISIGGICILVSFYRRKKRHASHTR